METEGRECMGYFKSGKVETSQMAQRLRRHASNAGPQVKFLVQGTRSPMRQWRSCIVKINQCFFETKLKSAWLTGGLQCKHRGQEGSKP